MVFVAVWQVPGNGKRQIQNVRVYLLSSNACNNQDEQLLILYIQYFGLVYWYSRRLMCVKLIVYFCNCTFNYKVKCNVDLIYLQKLFHH